MFQFLHIAIVKANKTISLPIAGLQVTKSGMSVLQVQQEVTCQTPLQIVPLAEMEIVLTVLVQYLILLELVQLLILPITTVFRGSYYRPMLSPFDQT